MIRWLWLLSFVTIVKMSPERLTRLILSWWRNCWTVMSLWMEVQILMEIRRTVRSVILKALASLHVDRWGLSTIARRTCSTFSGVLTLCGLPSGFFLVAAGCSSEICYPQLNGVMSRNTVVTMNIEVLAKRTLCCNHRFIVSEHWHYHKGTMLCRPVIHDYKMSLSCVIEFCYSCTTVYLMLLLSWWRQR